MQYFPLVASTISSTATRPRCGRARCAAGKGVGRGCSCGVDINGKATRCRRRSANSKASRGSGWRASTDRKANGRSCCRCWKCTQQGRHQNAKQQQQQQQEQGSQLEPQQRNYYPRHTFVPPNRLVPVVAGVDANKFVVAVAALHHSAATTTRRQTKQLRRYRHAT